MEFWLILLLFNINSIPHTDLITLYDLFHVTISDSGLFIKQK